ncbi:SDR family oxidoreductase [Rhizobium sp. P32RR-XVIII]|uniref:SDR family NAD(P)-dependent oxidoreductase n=1 Tax=Rhizobium sp. P32RR-XVIII TaxID=2726738 RepID=UPI0014563EE3|nr:SDR family oxidoreductase [Rhizobium sp. P32RR-XVIII]NLS04196.1 SDR family oxidoreductase [Rhizobium sp. P32RR-XVIII]
MTGHALEGGVALVTGGGGEIGGAIACRFASEGAAIVVADMREEAAIATASAIKDRGGQAHAVRLDIRDPAAVRAAIDACVDRFGKLTSLVNTAAAVTPDSTVEMLDLDDWANALAVNLTGAFLTCKYAIRHLRRAGGGTIVNIASQLAYVGPPGRAVYSTTKAALIQFTKCLAVDHAGDGIRANTLSPGAIDTLRTMRRYGSRDEANRARGPNHLLGRTGRVEEIAAGALFLASEESSFMTGTDLLIDGGYLAFKGSRPSATASSTSSVRR